MYPCDLIDSMYTLLGIDPAENSALAARRLYGVEVVTGSVLAMPSAASSIALWVTRSRRYSGRKCTAVSAPDVSNPSP